MQGWPERECIKLVKMARHAEDYLYGDDLDAVLTVIDADFYENDDDFDAELKALIDDIPNDQSKSGFKCDFCDKVCITKRGLTRHCNAKHKNEYTQTEPNSLAGSEQVVKMPEEILHPLYFKKYVENSVAKLGEDECYPQEVMNEFKAYKVGTLNDVNCSYALIRDLISSFDGDAEKFYPKFYKIIAETEVPFKNLSRNCSLLLGFEVANHVLAHLSGSTFKEDVLTFKHDSRQFSDKERSIICYLSGYVFGTFYRRIRFSKSSCNTSLYHQQCLSLLLAGKSTDENKELSEHKLVNAQNRGGLWKVTQDVISIFAAAESHFVTATKRAYNKIDCHLIVSALMKDSWVLLNFSKIRSSSIDKVKKEVAFNLLEDLLTLYIRVRTFSYVKDKQQSHKIQKSKSKSRSLRTSIKQQSSSLDQGH